MDDQKIVILTRDINGKRNSYKFKNRRVLYEFINSCKRPDSTDEILLVLQDGVCIYSQLMSSYSVLWEDICGFYA